MSTYSREKRLPLLINGFVREIVNQSHPNLQFERNINKICSDFYFQEEYFAFTGYGITSPDGGKTINKNNMNYLTSNYGKISIDSATKAVCEWTIKINYKQQLGGCMAIGVATDLGPPDEDFSDNIDTSYAYRWDGYKNFDSDDDEFMGYGDEYGTGDEIKVRLDLKERNIEFFRNGESQDIAFYDIRVGFDVAYKLAVCVQNPNTSLMIKSFSIDAEDAIL